ncbi:hypothetical protein Pelo_1035 [Pelomyxa schiedti]|nr:hypothetical protein Pelo_1035 [Pelomyxa schiedti]
MRNHRWHVHFSKNQGTCCMLIILQEEALQEEENSGQDPVREISIKYAIPEAFSLGDTDADSDLAHVLIRGPPESLLYLMIDLRRSFVDGVLCVIKEAKCNIPGIEGQRVDAHFLRSTGNNPRDVVILKAELGTERCKILELEDTAKGATEIADLSSNWWNLQLCPLNKHQFCLLNACYGDGTGWYQVWECNGSTTISGKKYTLEGSRHIAEGGHLFSLADSRNRFVMIDITTGHRILCVDTTGILYNLKVNDTFKFHSMVPIEKKNRSKSGRHGEQRGGGVGGARGGRGVAARGGGPSAAPRPARRRPRAADQQRRGRPRHLRQGQGARGPGGVLGAGEGGGGGVAAGGARVPRRPAIGLAAVGRWSERGPQRVVPRARGGREGDGGPRSRCVSSYAQIRRPTQHS